MDVGSGVGGECVWMLRLGWTVREIWRGREVGMGSLLGERCCGELALAAYHLAWEMVFYVALLDSLSHAESRVGVRGSPH